MNKPSITDPKVKKYVEYLERKLEALNSEDAEVDSYLALKNFIKQGNKIMRNANFDGDELSDKEDKALERGLKFADKVLEYNDDLKELEEKTGKEKIKKEEGKKESASAYEAVMPPKK